MMSNFVEKYECERFGSQPRVKGQPTGDRDSRLILKLHGLGIDYCEIQLELEGQIGERLPEIAEEGFQYALAIGCLCLKHLLFR